MKTTKEQRQVKMIKAFAKIHEVSINNLQINSIVQKLEILFGNATKLSYEERVFISTEVKKLT